MAKPDLRCRRLAALGCAALTWVLALPVVVALAGGEDVVVHECSKAEKPPSIDGKLDDAAWKAAAAAEIPYKFMAQTPQPAASRSTFQLCYDARALYLAAVFYRDSDAPLKQNHKGRDDPDLWTDDSTEIYLDPHNTGRFFKLIVSCAGVLTDFQQTEKGLDYSWNANGAEVRTLIEADKWSLELSLPWADLGVKLPERELWGFEILRFSGKNWASWTVGASYARPEKFGLIAFGEGFFKGLERLLAVAGRSKGDRWRLVSRLGILDYASDRAVLDQGIAEAARKLGEARLNAANVPSAEGRRKVADKLAALQTRLDELGRKSAPKLESQALKEVLYQLSVLSIEATDLSYEAMIQEMLGPGK
jgi:hypothetical protein